MEVITVGRSSIDLYSNDIGSPFHQISSFNAYVGGSSTNIAVGCARLGIKTGLVSAVGADKVGDFILHFLAKERVDSRYVFTKEKGRSSAVLLGVEPPDTFPLVYYRERAADVMITADDLASVSLEGIRYAVVSGTSLSKEPSRTAVTGLVKRVHSSPCQLILDLDYRHDQWKGLPEYREMIDKLLRYSDVVLGTEEEVLAACDADAKVTILDQQISAPDIRGELPSAIERVTSTISGPLILKTGADGAEIHQRASTVVPVPGFKAEVLNILGAGDAFAAGLLYGLLNDWPLERSVRMGNACGAWIVEKHGCANFSPTLDQIMEFTRKQGGL